MSDDLLRPWAVLRPGPVRTVATADDRRAQGLHHWVDGTMGFHRRAGRTTVVAPNGPVLALHRPKGGDLLGGLVAAGKGISGLPPSVDHASGGPLYFDDEHAQLLLIYHGETFRDGDPQDYYAFLGMAVSDDEGDSFEDLGRIITSPLEEHDPHRPRPVDVGAGGYVVRDGWFYVYFQDRGIGTIRQHLSVARAPVAEVVTAARERRAPSFTKHSGTGWDQPGLGGRGGELLWDGRYPVIWFDVAVIEPLASVVVVFSTVEAVVRGVARWNHGVALSTDGLRWSRPRLLHRRSRAAEMIYVTIDSGEVDQRRITGPGFDLYRTRSTSSDRWADATLERVPVRWDRRGGSGPFRP